MRKPKLSDSQVDQAVRILDGWHEKLTWDSYLKVLDQVTGVTITRQGIREYSRITDTFDQAKSRIAIHRQTIGAKAGIVRYGDMALAYEVEKNTTLKAKIERLERENRDLLEQFQRWQYNAQTNGLGPEVLNRPLPTRKTHHDRQTYKSRERSKREDV